MQFINVIIYILFLYIIKKNILKYINLKNFDNLLILNIFSDKFEEF